MSFLSPLTVDRFSKEEFIPYVVPDNKMNVTKNGNTKQAVTTDLGKGAVLGKMEMSGEILELISGVFRFAVSLVDRLKITTDLLDKFGLVSNNLRSFIIFQFLQKNHYYA